MTRPSSGLTVVTVLYRSRDMLAVTLPTWLRSAAGLAVDFVFVDHSPEHGCESLIAGLMSREQYQYLQNPTNPGFAAGCNAGVGSASADHVLLLNPDVALNEDALAKVMKAAADRPDQPVAVGLTMSGAEYTGIALNSVSFFIDRRSGSVRGPIGPSGGAALFPVALYQRFGGLYEDLFAWGEDADLALRLYAAGVRTEALDLALQHAWGHSVAGDATLTARRAYLLARNRVIVAIRNLSWPLLVLGTPLAVVAHLALAVRRVRQGTLRPFLRGVARGVVEGARARRDQDFGHFGLRDLVGYLRTERARP
jgi:N-acetylglucosaminyl-diphospho-decaprenol L-rhamnosyltransferase